MDRDTARWLAGKVSAIRDLQVATEHTIRMHCPEAADELNGVGYALNRCENVLGDRTEPKKESSGESGT